MLANGEFFVEFQSALPRGERRSVILRRGLSCDFNPRSHEGSDGDQTILCDVSLYFNPRSHEGSDKGRTVPGNTPVYFNPRSHEGSDLITLLNMRLSNRFQSALPRGERLCVSDVMKSASSDFNPRSREGSDTLMRMQSPNTGNFNPRSREGSDLNSISARCDVEIFQSALPRGERQFISCNNMIV